MSTDLPNSVSGKSTTEEVRRWTPDELVGSFREIFVSKDLDGLQEMLAPWAILRSPYLTTRLFTFTGRDQVCLSLWGSFGFTRDLTVTEEFVGERSAGLHFHYTQRGETVHGVILCSLDEEGRADVLDVLIQGLVPVARFGNAFARRVSMPRNAAEDVFVNVTSGLVVVVSRAVDAVACRMFRTRAPRHAPRVMSLPRNYPPRTR